MSVNSHISTNKTYNIHVTVSLDFKAKYKVALSLEMFSQTIYFLAAYSHIPFKSKFSVWVFSQEYFNSTVPLPPASQTFRH